MLISNGRVDPLVSAEETEQLAALLRLGGRGRDRRVAEQRPRAHAGRRDQRAGMAGEAAGTVETRPTSQRWRIGFSTTPARNAVAKFIAMMMPNTGIHDP